MATRGVSPRAHRPRSVYPDLSTGAVMPTRCAEVAQARRGGGRAWMSGLRVPGCFMSELY